MATRWLDEREARAWEGLMRMQLRLGGLLGRDLAATSGLSHQDYVVLVALTSRPDGRARMFELGRELGWERSRLSHHVARMVGRGLLCREECEADRRGAFVRVTASGKVEIEAAAPDHVESVRRYFVDCLTPAQLDALADVAETVLSSLEANQECQAEPTSDC